MIALHRIMAVVRRHFLLSFARFNRLFNVIYWPFVNIVIWGVTSIWIQSFSQDPYLIQTILLGLVLWQIVFRVNLETARGLFEELIHHNVVHIFSTPLTLTEWILAMMIMGMINMVIVLFVSSFSVWLLYGVNILDLGWHLIPFSLLLLCSAWFIGFFICGLLIYWGLKAQDFIGSIGYIFAPFSAVFYPLEALPKSAQVIGN
jgi:ABC-2 type transport system permease protein